MKGLFITIEGPDGSGKSTQIKKLAQFLQSEGLPFIQTREPGGTIISDAIRQIILNPEYEGLKDETEILLYAASRAQHVREKIKPALEKGHIVLCDRFVDASIAYQGYGLEQSITDIRKINDFAVQGLTPDRTYLIDIDPFLARQRMTKRLHSEYSSGLDRIEQRHLAYHERVRKGFYDIFGEHKQRICMIDGNQHEEDVFKAIIGDVEVLLKSWGY